MKYIETFRDEEPINGIYLCKAKKSAVTKAGKPYESLTLQDKTGTISGKIWDLSSQGIEDYDAMDYVHVVGKAGHYNDEPQLNITRIRRASEGEYDPADYLPVSERDVDEMYKELMHYVETVKNPYLKQVLTHFFGDADFEKRFKFHSAAKSVHHGFVGGLLEHTLGVTKNCAYFAQTYPLLNKDLLITAALCHDIGKLEELSVFPENDYTDEGQLLGHIMIGAQMITDAIRSIDGFPAKLSNELVHCVLAHHGELEYGSPKKPALVEALALSFADNLDAKMETFKEAFATTPQGNTKWIGYNKFLESNIRRTSE